MSYRNPNECPHNTVTLNRLTGSQQCGECGTIVVPTVVPATLRTGMEWDLQITARGTRVIQVPRVRCPPTCTFCHGQ